MKYICKKNFLDGKDEKGKIRQCKIGEIYEGARGEELEAAGFIVSQDKMNLDELAVLEKKILAAKAELAALQGKLLDLRAKLQNAEPNDELEIASGRDPDEEEEHEDDGEEEPAHDESKPLPPAGLKGKALKAWKKKNW